MGVGLTLGPRGNKQFCFKSGWNHCTLDTTREFIAEHDNGLALITGDRSDVIAVDVDKMKPGDTEEGRLDGLQLIDDLIQQHGPLECPTQLSGSGGRHYIFSLSKSLDAGLNAASNTQKMRYQGQPVTIDIRGDGGMSSCALSSCTVIIGC